MKIPKPIKILLLSTLLVAILAIGFFTHYGWTAEQRLCNSMTSAHRKVLAYAARGGGYVSSEPDKAIVKYRQAIALEPYNREWKSSLAFALWKAKRIPEAIPIWRHLTGGNDDIAIQAKKWLSKPSVLEASKQ